MTNGDPLDQNGVTATATMVHLDRLAGWMAHEVNNPIGGISNAFALIKDAIPSSHRHYKYVAAIEREIARVAALTLRVRQAYQFDAERTGPRTLAAWLGDALQALEPLRTARQVQLLADPGPVISRTLVRGEIAGAAIRHLLQHAIESAPPGATIALGVSIAGERIVLSVPDAATNDHAARAPVAGPHGLALELARQLARSLDGELTFTHNPEQAGEIRLALPLMVDDQGTR